MSAQVPLYSEAALSLLKTNERLRPVEEASFHAELERAKKQRNALDKKIKTLVEEIKVFPLDSKRPQAKLDRLKETRRLVDKFIDDHNFLLSPFRRCHVPLEIWAQIFHYAEPIVHITDNMHPRFLGNSDTSIWRFGHVCSDWRTALLSWGSLWSELSIQVVYSDRYAPLILEQALSRSRNAPLKFSLYISEYVPSASENSDAFVRLLAAASHRWHTADITCSMDKTLLLLSKVKGQIPMLQELELFIKGTAALELQEAPSLRKVDIFSPKPTSLQLPWSQLRECNMEGISDPHHELDFLRMCTNLETYSLGSRMQESFSSDVVHMPKLRTLHFDMWGQLAVLENLTLPSLATIVLRSRSFDGDSDRFLDILDRFKGFVSRSDCNLTHMEINYISTRSHLNFSIFIKEKCFEHLTCLKLGYNMPCEILSEILTIKPKCKNVVLPRLERLHLHHHPLCEHDNEISDLIIGLAYVVQMVRSRWRLTEKRRKTASRLRFFKYEHHCLPLPSSRPLSGALAPLLYFREEGLELEVDSFYLQGDDRFL